MLCRETSAGKLAQGLHGALKLAKEMGDAGRYLGESEISTVMNRWHSR